MLGPHPFHVVGKKYADAVRLAGGIPIILPNLRADEIDSVLNAVDGVMLTGSPSNVHPSRFGEDVLDAALPLDPERDEATLQLVPAALERGMPLLAICRGMQEVNVALGGTLHQAVHRVGVHEDHREDREAPVEQQYAAAHAVQVQPGGALDALLDSKIFSVNSLHGQAVNRLADALRVEALSLDGVIEAYSVRDYQGFGIGVQWHPEWLANNNAVSMRLLAGFGSACHGYRDHRLRRAT